MNKRFFINALILLLASTIAICLLIVVVDYFSEYQTFKTIFVALYLIGILALGIYRIYLEERFEDDDFEDAPEEDEHK